jgi:hypothetical protein
MERTTIESLIVDGVLNFQITDLHTPRILLLPQQTRQHQTHNCFLASNLRSQLSDSILYRMNTISFDFKVSFGSVLSLSLFLSLGWLLPFVGKTT